MQKVKNFEKLKDLFWDYSWSSVLKNLKSPYVIGRVLEIGDEKQVKLFFKEVGKETIEKFLKLYGKRILSKISYNFWKYYYEKNIVKRT